MDSPVLELKIISANDLKKPSPFSPTLQPYVVVSISGPGADFPAHKTPVDPEGGRNPTWNHPLTFSVPGGVATGGTLTIRFKILSRRALAADKLIGKVCVPLRDLFRTPAAGDSQAAAKFVSYQVKKPSGRSKGVLTFSYRLAGKSPSAAMAAEPVMAYPAKPSATSTAIFYPPTASAPPAGIQYPAVELYKHDIYPPPPASATSYGYPAQVGYGSYPSYGSYGYGCPGHGYGYGYSGQVVQPNRKKNNGLGLGAGLLGGALAGLVVGDLVSDAAFDFGGGDGFF